MSGSARDAILSRIRHANGARPRDEARQRVVDERLAEAPEGVIPARGQLSTAGRIALFRDMAEKASATVAAVTDYSEVPEAVAFWLRQNNFPATIKMGDDPRFAGADFGTTALTVLKGASSGDDLNALSHAAGAIAETGTLMLTSGPDNPTSLNFLPENHVVVLAAKDVAGDMETLWTMLRERYGKGEMPRSVNFVTGPSRSADIEQTLLLGAHGTPELCILSWWGKTEISGLRKRAAGLRRALDEATFAILEERFPPALSSFSGPVPRIQSGDVGRMGK